MKKRAVVGSDDTLLVAECGDNMIAFPTGKIVAGRLADGVDVAKSSFDGTRPGEKARLPPVATIDGEQWVAWDMGLLLGKRAANHAWVLVRLPYAGTTLRLALRTGRCLAVAAAGKRLPLPRGMFARRAGALSSAFIVDESIGAGPASVGRLCVCIDVQQLWSAYELQLSAQALGFTPTLGAVP
jgi:hypothetical protein